MSKGHMSGQVSGFKDCKTMELFQRQGTGIKKNGKLKRQLEDWADLGVNPRMALWGRKKLGPKVVSSHWYTWKTGMVPQTKTGDPVAEPASGREMRRQSVYLKTYGTSLIVGGRCLFSKGAFVREMKGGSMSLGRHVVAYSNKGGNDQLEISSTICRQKSLSCFKTSSFSYWENVFNKSFII